MPDLDHELVLLDNGPLATINLVGRDRGRDPRPAILMLGAATPDTMPEWAHSLLDDGYVIVSFGVEHEPDPDPERRPVWLHFDERFAHSYVLGGYQAPIDTGRVVDYLGTRGDIDLDKLGWIGSSSTAIPGLSVVTRGPRLAAYLGFVATGAYRRWIESWHTHGLWNSDSDELWPETEELLAFDPILHVDGMFPTAVCLVSGGADKVVDPATTEEFVEAARPFYKDDPDRLRHIVYQGMGHNLPADAAQMHINHWFRTYMHPTEPPPAAPEPAADLQEAVERTQITGVDHQDVVGAG